MGELEVSEKGKLPKLVEEKDMRGVLHVHSEWSDGTASIAEMAAYSAKRGYEYVGICDHSKSAAYAGGLNDKDVEAQHKEIDSLNKKLKDIVILKGTECDILVDGSLDYSDKVLTSFDFVVASVHSKFKMTKAEMTKRICTALKNKYTTILGHPTGRLLLSRHGYDIDVEEVIRTAAGEGVAIEINAQPQRLDLDWRYCHYAKEKGVKIAICTDSHVMEGIDDMILGIGIARKGWLEAEDILNTMSVEELMKWFKS
jgi:DNA polymerase (family 10)